MGDVQKFYPKDAAKNPDNVLEQAVGHYESVLVIGYDKNDNLQMRSSHLSRERIIWMIERFKFKLMRGDYDDDSDSN